MFSCGTLNVFSYGRTSREKKYLDKCTRALTFFLYYIKQNEASVACGDTIVEEDLRQECVTLREMVFFFGFGFYYLSITESQSRD